MTRKRYTGHRQDSITVHHTLTWAPLDVKKIRGLYIQSWGCTTYPGVVLTWVSKESVASASSFPFSGFNKENLQTVLAEWERLSTRLNKRKSRVRLTENDDEQT